VLRSWWLACRPMGSPRSETSITSIAVMTTLWVGWLASGPVLVGFRSGIRLCRLIADGIFQIVVGAAVGLAQEESHDHQWDRRIEHFVPSALMGKDGIVAKHGSIVGAMGIVCPDVNASAG